MLTEKINAIFPLCHRIFFQPFPIFSSNVHITTAEELKYYCDEPQPVGALMLTGEWGCGKTYLLNNSLSNVLKDKCVFLRVSLFGMASIEEVKKEVKQCWLRTVAELNTPASGWVEKAQKYTEVFKTVADKGAEHLPEPWKSIVSGVLSNIKITLLSPILGSTFTKSIALKDNTPLTMLFQGSGRCSAPLSATVLKTSVYF